MRPGTDDTDNVERRLTASGITVTGEDVEAVARSLARIEAAAAILLHPLSFDETDERFYRLIEGDAAEDAA
jgi:uncharacterized 2Fe-2S/4Fe-4S cluster protein (DUF4445 family)